MHDQTITEQETSKTVYHAKNKHCYFKAIRQDMTCFETGHQPF